MPNVAAPVMHALLGVLALTLGGCSSMNPAPTLDGTSWRLVSIQSMDDEQGATSIPDPSKFTVSFGTDGRATFQIDCNRGEGSWEATQTGEDASGALMFGPIATTKMRCPQPALGQRVAEALSFVRGYLVKDRQLHMSMLDDNGILTWEPLRP